MAENKCDELFGKNGELVEYRKKQVLEGAFGIIQRHYEDKPNKMEVVAALFGKKLGEEFTIKDLITGKIYVASFCNYGMRAYIEGIPSTWLPRRDMVMRLIVGEAIIVD